MEKEQIKNVSLEELGPYLAQYCEQRESYNHLRDLTEEELNDKREEYALRAIEISKLELELADIKASFKSKLKPLYEDNSKSLHVIESKEDYFKDTVYPIYDFESGMVELYNEDGILLHTRPLTEMEHQLRIEMAEESAADTFSPSISFEEKE